MVKADELVVPVANIRDKRSVADTASIASAATFSSGYGVLDKRYSGKAIHWTSLANRILYSRYYVLLYIFIFLMSAFLLIWGLMYHQFLDNIRSEEVWYIALDVFTSVVLVFEIALRIVATHETFWKSWINRLDVVVVIVVAGSLLLHIVDPESIGVIGSAVMTLRYFTQIVRLAIVVKLHRDRQLWLKAAADNFIDFNNIEYTETARQVGIVPPGDSGGSDEALLRGETVMSPELVVSAAGSKYRFRLADMDQVKDTDESIDDAWQVVSIDGMPPGAQETPTAAANGATPSRPEFGRHSRNPNDSRSLPSETQSAMSGAGRRRRVPQRHAVFGGRSDIPKNLTILVEEELPADGRILNSAAGRQVSRTFDQTNSGRTYEEYYASEDDALLYSVAGSNGSHSRRSHSHFGTTTSLPAGTYAQYQTVDTIDERHGADADSVAAESLLTEPIMGGGGGVHYPASASRAEHQPTPPIGSSGGGKKGWFSFLPSLKDNESGLPQEHSIPRTGYAPRRPDI